MEEEEEDDNQRLLWREERILESFYDFID